MTILPAAVRLRTVAARSPQRASFFRRQGMIPVFPPVVRLVVSVRRATSNGIPLKRVTNTGKRKNTVGPSRTATIGHTLFLTRGAFHPVSRTRRVVSGVPWIPNSSTPPASTRTSIPSGADPRVKASMCTMSIHSGKLINNVPKTKTVELGRVDICCEVSMLSSCLALPREGHLQQLLHMFSYLEKKHNTEMVFDPSVPHIDQSMFPCQDWSNTVYATADCLNSEGKMEERLPEDLPKAHGRGFVMRVFVDSDHAGDTVTRRSRIGFLEYLNNALVYWTSKKQTGVETSSFGSEFMAMKHATEYVRGLRYKLRSMGIPVDDCIHISLGTTSLYWPTLQHHTPS